MAKPTKLSSKTIRLARQQMETAQTAEDVRRALCILLPAELGITQTCAAHVLHLRLATVKRYQTALFLDAHEKRPQHRRRGGRHHETLSVDGEREFLAKWSQRAAQGCRCGERPARGDPAPGGKEGSALHGVSDAGASRMAQSGPGHAPSQERPRGAGSL